MSFKERFFGRKLPQNDRKIQTKNDTVILSEAKNLTKECPCLVGVIHE